MQELLIAIGANIVVGALTALLIYVSSRRSQRKRPAGLTAPAQAFDLFRAQFPDSDFRNVTLTADGRNALADLADGSGIGLLQGYGQRWNARLLHRGDVASIQMDDTALRLKLTDYGAPRAVLQLADANERALWHARLQDLVRTPETSLSHA